MKSVLPKQYNKTKLMSKITYCNCTKLYITNFFVIAYFDKNVLLAMANGTHYTAYKAVKRDLVYISLQKYSIWIKLTVE